MPRKKLRATSVVPRNRAPQRKRLADIIDCYGSFVDVPCDQCILFGSFCIAMSDRSKSCSNCLRFNRPCCGRTVDQCEWAEWELDKFRADCMLFNSDMEVTQLSVDIHRKQEELSKLQESLNKKLKKNLSLRSRSREVSERGASLCDSDLQTITASDVPSGPAISDSQFDALIGMFSGDTGSPLGGRSPGAP